MIHIFIETENKPTNEWRFIEHLVCLLHGSMQGVEIHGTGGYTNLSRYREKMAEYGATGEKIVIIFDADYSHSQGGFAARSAYINKEMDEMGVDFDLFLFPNNKEDGNFEDLLEKIVAQKHQGILDCFNRYQLCIECKWSPDTYKTPVQKSKMYAYIDTMKESTTKQIREGNWSFDKTEYWNFDAEYLNPLKEFIRKQLPSNRIAEKTF